MDSCHLFNFLFGTRKATSELRKCFSQQQQQQQQPGRRQGQGQSQSQGKAQTDNEKPEATAATANKRKKSCERPAAPPKPQLQSPDQPPSSPLKQIQQLRLASSKAAAGNGPNSLVAAAHESSASQSSVFSTSTHEIIIEDKQQRPLAARQLPANGIYAAHLVKLDDCVGGGGLGDFVQLDENNNNNNCPSVIREKPTGQLDELTRTEAPTRTTTTTFKINLYDNPLSSGGLHKELPLEQSSTMTANQIIDKTTSLSKSERVKNLVQTFELPPPSSPMRRRESLEAAGDTPTRERVRMMSKQNSGDNCNRQASATPQSPRGPAPRTPPKSTRAKCLNWQLVSCGQKARTASALFQDAAFLRAHFFRHLEPLERCSAAQVCRTWRNVLYADPAYWKDLVGVIDCTQLRREHLVECILNTLQSAKLKHHHPAGHHHHHYHAHHHQASRPNGSQIQMISTIDQQQQQQPQQAPSQQDASALIQNLSQLDQDEVWRIQELCNRFTTRGSGFSIGASSSSSNAAHTNASSNQRAPATTLSNSSNNNNNGAEQTTNSSDITHQTTTTTTTTTTTSGIANSKSSSSQISSSTLSSVSLSSLLSPLSESSRVESIRERLYVALDERGFESVCLFGATDDDIEDLVSKTRPNGAQAHIKLGKLSNCPVSDRGLESFLATFGQLEELELTGCNEITNSVDLRGLAHLRRLVVTDCINIADGFAQRLAEIFPQLDTLVLQAYHLTDAFLEYLGQSAKSETVAADTCRLRRLELPDCKEITNNSALTIAKSFGAQLEVLSLSGSAKINDDGVEILAEHMKRLRSLDLGWMRMSDFALECLACDLRDLRELVLDRNTQISDLGLGYLATSSCLRLVHVRWCAQLTDQSVRALASMRSLRQLSLAGLHQVTARGLLELVEAPWLEELELTNCPAVTADLLAFLSARLPACNIIF